MQTMYVTETRPAETYRQAWQGATAVYTGHNGVVDGIPISSAPELGPYEHLQPSHWIDQTGEGYRRCCTSNSWVGQALALRVLNAESIWQHPAFFDYVDRWMYEDDTQHVADILAQTGTDYSVSWARQGQTSAILKGSHPNSNFIDQMFEVYNFGYIRVSQMA